MSPGIIARASFDMINFSYWWSDVVGTLKSKPIGMKGVDTRFIITVVVFFCQPFFSSLPSGNC
jgi:hypothetical protein